MSVSAKKLIERIVERAPKHQQHLTEKRLKKMMKMGKLDRKDMKKYLDDQQI